MTTQNNIAYYRHRAKASQKEMATNMQVPLRTYEDIEAGKSTFRPLHETAAQMALLRLAVAKQDGTLLTEGLANLIIEAAKLIEK
ncbi:XRE family transcriptional regulator [Ochrobactrum sp. SFR4]|uniref:XRE family transcriptional regulator n=1 Tax=Ochrobactrum sp. SFR4 TaxID=2717368 RepID=UPI000E29E6C7|nr:XRE family transcriptional regulator [Ochrobactrum sp. SFR4]AXH76942.1 MAG: transcriptional regulator [Caudoviricetes sp.]MBX8825261.1 XRE family transcriptional regulator [Ochrobactrum sp. SFR4]